MIGAKKDPTTWTPRHAWIFKNFGAELYYDETNGISSINHGLLHFVHIQPPYNISFIILRNRPVVSSVLIITFKWDLQAEFWKWKLDGLFSVDYLIFVPTYKILDRLRSRWEFLCRQSYFWLICTDYWRESLNICFNKKDKCLVFITYKLRFWVIVIQN